MKEAGLALALALAPCGCRRPATYYAVGAQDYNASPVSCAIAGNAAGALRAVPDHHETADGRGLVFEAVKPGEARIECKDGNHGLTIEVRAPVKLVLRRAHGSSAPFPVGAYAPVFCLKALDEDGAELELGRWVEGAVFEWSEHVSRVYSHGLGGSGNASCAPQGLAVKEGAGTITGTWRGLSATAGFEVKGRSR
jgi:hypothetical protein